MTIRERKKLLRKFKRELRRYYNGDREQLLVDEVSSVDNECVQNLILRLHPL